MARRSDSPHKRAAKAPAPRRPGRVPAPPVMAAGDAGGASLDQGPDIFARALDLANRIEATNCCRDEPQRTGLARTRNALDIAFRAMLAMANDRAPVSGPGYRALGRIALNALKQLTAIPAHQRPKAGGYVDPRIFLGAGPAIFADVIGPNPFGPPPGLPPEPPLGGPGSGEAFEKLIEQLIRLLEEAKANGGPAGEIDEIIEELHAWLAALRSGNPFSVEGVIKYLLDVLRDFSRILGRLGSAGKRILGELLELLADYLEGGANFLVADAGEAVAGTLLGALAAMIAALVAGIAVGMWLRTVSVGDRTIDEWLTDALYLEYFAPDDDCDDLWAAYLRARNERRSYQNSAPTLDKDVMRPLLDHEYSLLSRYLKSNCEDDTGDVLKKELARVGEALRRLMP